MTQTRPNIIVLHAHDLGRFLGCYGVGTLETPNLDRLAAQGIRFSRAQCTSPGCSPARAALFTGHYPHTTGVMGLTHARFAWRMRDSVTHLSRHLAEGGYHTALAGIVHEDNPADRERQQQHHGFGEILARHGERAEALAEKVAEWLRTGRPSHRPFYLQCGFFEPHRLLTGDPETDRDCLPFVDAKVPPPDPEEAVEVPGYLEDCAGTRQEMRELQASVRQLDTEVGRILDTLEDEGIAENTLIVFTTDHGLALPRAKSTLYEPGLEVALLMRFPESDKVTPGVRDALVSHIDVVPTVLECAGLPLPEDIPGRSLMPLARGETETHREHLFAEKTFHDSYDPRRSVCDGRFKLIANLSHSPSFADSSQAWRPRARPRVPEAPGLAYTPDFELYDLQADPWEQTNRAEDSGYAEDRDRLIATLGRWMRETEDPLLEGQVAPPAYGPVRDRLAGGAAT